MSDTERGGSRTGEGTRTREMGVGCESGAHEVGLVWGPPFTQLWDHHSAHHHSHQS